MNTGLSIKEIDFNSLPQYIKCAWEGDNDLSVFYDKAIEEKSLENMINDTRCKIEGLSEMHDGVEILGIEYQEKVVGFIVLNDKLNYLYSFGINTHFRKKDILEEVFFYIKNKLKTFFCLLNKYNNRAISWLKKCGMTEHPRLSPNQNITYLKYDLCQ